MRCSPSKSARIIVGSWCGAWYLSSQRGAGSLFQATTMIPSFALWICGSAVHGAAASACCTDAVLSGASGPALVKGDGHWESHSAGNNCMILTRLCKSGCFTGRCAPQSEWVWAGRFAWVGQQGCQATRHAPQTVASISAAASSVDEEKYLRKTVVSFKVVGAALYRGNFGRHGDNGAAAMAACRRRS